MKFHSYFTDRRSFINETRKKDSFSALRWLEGLFVISLILYFTRDILIPLSFALLVSFILYPACAWIERRGVNRMLSIILALLAVVVLGAAVMLLFTDQLIRFANELPALEVKIQEGIKAFSNFLTQEVGVSSTVQDTVINDVKSSLGSRMVDIVQKTIYASVSSAVLVILIPVYVVLILYYRSYWMLLLQRLFPGERKEELHRMIHLSIQAYYQFIKGMLIVYVIVGLLNSIGLLLLGIPHPFLFGFVASILTFIPYLGIIVGSLLPIAMAWITFDSVLYPLGVVGIFVFVQYLEANLIFPLAVSQKLNVNALSMLLAIFLGGLIWGLSGMILFVPFAGILKLIADHNPRWKTVSMILGTGKT